MCMSGRPRRARSSGFPAAYTRPRHRPHCRRPPPAARARRPWHAPPHVLAAGAAAPYVVAGASSRSPSGMPGARHTRAVACALFGAGSGRRSPAPLRDGADRERRHTLPWQRRRVMRVRTALTAQAGAPAGARSSSGVMFFHPRFDRAHARPLGCPCRCGRLGGCRRRWRRRCEQRRGVRCGTSTHLPVHNYIIHLSASSVCVF
jgi:hypothetical protein